MAISAEEKANELIEKFKEFAPFKPYKDDAGTWLYKASEELNAAKQCAAICANEIIRETIRLDKWTRDYWQQVLNHINSKP